MFIFSYKWRVVFAKEIRVRVSWVGVRVGPTIGKSQIQSLTQISNLPRNGFKSFSEVSNPHFSSILKSFSKSDLKSNRKSFTKKMIM